MLPSQISKNIGLTTSRYSAETYDLRHDSLAVHFCTCMWPVRSGPYRGDSEPNPSQFWHNPGLPGTTNNQASSLGRSALLYCRACPRPTYEPSLYTSSLAVVVNKPPPPFMYFSISKVYIILSTSSCLPWIVCQYHLQLIPHVALLVVLGLACGFSAMARPNWRIVYTGKQYRDSM